MEFNDFAIFRNSGHLEFPTWLRFKRSKALQSDHAAYEIYIHGYNNGRVGVNCGWTDGHIENRTPISQVRQKPEVRSRKPIFR